MPAVDPQSFAKLATQLQNGVNQFSDAVDAFAKEVAKPGKHSLADNPGFDRTVQILNASLVKLGDVVKDFSKKVKDKVSGDEMLRALDNISGNIGTVISSKMEVLKLAGSQPNAVANLNKISDKILHSFKEEIHSARARIHKVQVRVVPVVEAIAVTATITTGAKPAAPTPAPAAPAPTTPQLRK